MRLRGEMSKELLQTPLSGLWAEMGARMVEFAGYNMPVQFKDGVINEHVWTRENAGLFDVSHMGPSNYELLDKSGLTPDEAHIKIAKVLEPVLPCDIQGLKRGQIRYTTLLNDDGGIIDDLMVARPVSDFDQGGLYIVVNAGGKLEDWRIFDEIGAGIAKTVRLDENALVALQGPKAKEAIKIITPEAANLGFMSFNKFQAKWGEVTISRSGYTGEDGFEILLGKDFCLEAINELLASEDVKPIGLGARDSLRLEAGLCLYGHDLDNSISPIEADLKWTIQKCRRERADFKASARILGELANGPSRKRVGIEFLDKAPAREGVEIQDQDGNKIGIITSGGFGPSLGGPLAMAYVDSKFAEIGTPVNLMVRGVARPAKICGMPFVPHNYYRP